MTTTDKMAVIERLLANRGLRIVRATLETVRIGPAAPAFQIPAYNQHIFILNCHELPPDTYVESDTNTRRYHVYGAQESANTMDEFNGLVNIILQDNEQTFGANMNKVHNVEYARIITAAL